MCVTCNFYVRSYQPLSGTSLMHLSACPVYPCNSHHPTTPALFTLCWKHTSYTNYLLRPTYLFSAINRWYHSRITWLFLNFSHLLVYHASATPHWQARRNVFKLYVHCSVTKLVNTILWKRMNRFWYQLAQIVHRAIAWNGQLWRSGGQRSRSRGQGQGHARSKIDMEAWRSTKLATCLSLWAHVVEYFESYPIVVLLNMII